MQEALMTSFELFIILNLPTSFIVTLFYNLFAENE